MNKGKTKKELMLEAMIRQLDTLSKLEVEHLTDTDYDDEGIFKSKSYRSEGWIDLSNYS